MQKRYRKLIPYLQGGASLSQLASAAYTHWTLVVIVLTAAATAGWAAWDWATTYGVVPVLLAGALMLAALLSIRANWPRSPPIDATDFKPPVPAETRPLTTYEIEKKLSAIDTALAIIREESALLKQGQSVVDVTKDARAISDPAYFTTYQGEVAKYSAEVQNQRERVHALRNELSPFPDVQSKLKYSSKSELQSVLFRHVQFIRLLSEHLNSDVPAAHLQEITSSSYSPIMLWLSDAIKRRCEAERDLVALRRMLSP